MSDDKFNGLEEFLQMLMGLSEESKTEEAPMPEHSTTEPSGNSEVKMKETPMPEHSATEPSHYKELAIDPRNICRSISPMKLTWVSLKAIS